MNSNLVVPVPITTAQSWIARLNDYIIKANSVSELSTYTRLKYAEEALHRANELYSVLHDIRELSNWQEVGEDLIRIGAKIENIQMEKSREVIRRRMQKGGKV